MAGGDFGTSSDSGAGRRPVDIDMNLIPFIDMMSVLVSFLLLTAVWTNLAQINIKPGGVGHDTETLPPQPPPINLSVLVGQDGLWVGITTGQPRKIDKSADGSYNWDALGEALQYYKKESGIFTDRDDIEIAAEDKVDYQSVITSMDTAVAKEFKGIRYVDPASLSVRFKQ
jgi:biopolymer transport protein TolR